jgi:hypothetical protein
VVFGEGVMIMGRREPLDKAHRTRHFLPFRSNGISMPLTPGHSLGYDNERMVFRFSMFCGDELVECQISAAAIDELVGGPRGSYVDRQTQFAQLRQTIERLASAKFEAGTVVRGTTLRIFAKDIPKATPQNDFTTSGKSPSRSA